MENKTTKIQPNGGERQMKMDRIYEDKKKGITIIAIKKRIWRFT